MRYQQQDDAVRHAQSLPALFTAFDAVLRHEGKGIVESATRELE